MGQGPGGGLPASRGAWVPRRGGPVPHAGEGGESAADEEAGRVYISVRIVERTEHGLVITVQWRPRESDPVPSSPLCWHATTPEKRAAVSPRSPHSRKGASARSAPPPPPGSSHRPRKHGAGAAPGTLPPEGEVHMRWSEELSRSASRRSGLKLPTPTSPVKRMGQSPGKSVPLSERTNKLSRKRESLLRILNATASEDELVLSRLIATPANRTLPPRLAQRIDSGELRYTPEGRTRTTNTASLPGSSIFDRNSRTRYERDDDKLLCAAFADDEQEDGETTEANAARAHQVALGECDSMTLGTSTVTSSSGDSDIESIHTFEAWPDSSHTALTQHPSNRPVPGDTAHSRQSSIQGHAAVTHDADNPLNSDAATGQCRISVAGGVHQNLRGESRGTFLAADARARLHNLLQEFAAEEATVYGMLFPTKIAASQRVGGEHPVVQERGKMTALPRAGEQDLTDMPPSSHDPEEGNVDTEQGAAARPRPLDGALLEKAQGSSSDKTDLLEATVSPGSVAARRKKKRLNSVSVSSPPPLDLDAINTQHSREGATVSELTEGIVLAALSPSMVRKHRELINQGTGGLPELAMSSPHAEYFNSSPLLGRPGASWLALSPITTTRTSALGGNLTVAHSPMAGARLQGSGAQQIPLSHSARAGARVSRWWTFDSGPYPTSFLARRLQSSAWKNGSQNGSVFSRHPSSRNLDHSGDECSPITSGNAYSIESGTLSSVEASSLLRSNLARRLESFEGLAEQVSPPLMSPLENPDRRSDSEWQIYPMSEALFTKTKLTGSRELAAPPSPDPSLTGASADIFTATKQSKKQAAATEEAGSSSIWEKVFGRDRRGVGAVLRHQKERVRGDFRQATHVFKVVHPDGVQYRKTPNFEARSRVYTRRWWDTEKTARGPDLGDVINVSRILGNWVQVAGKPGFWLPITGRQQQVLLELVNILGAYRDSPLACSAGLDVGHAGGWNPLLSSRFAIMSVDRRAVYFGAGRPAVALAEAGFDSGRHLTVVTILSMHELGYIGVAELPTDADIVNTSHLGIFGIAVGASSHKVKESAWPSGRSTAARSAGKTPMPAALSVSQDDANEPARLRIWLQGMLGPFVEPFQQGDEVGLLLDMTALTLDYFVNRRFVGMHKCQGVWAYMHVLRGCYAWLTSAYGATPARISSDLPPRPLYPAVGSHRLAKGGTCFAAAFNVPFSLSDDGKTLLYKNLH